MGGVRRWGTLYPPVVAHYNLRFVSGYFITTFIVIIIKVRVGAIGKFSQWSVCRSFYKILVMRTCITHSYWVE